MKYSKIALMFAGACACAGLVSCNTTVQQFEHPVESVSLDYTSFNLERDDELTLTATVSPENATLKTVIWTSSDSSVATVDEEGNVVAIKDGNVIITATTLDGNKTATCSIEVRTQNYRFVGEVSKKQSFLDYESNKTATSNEEKFYNSTSNYFAGAQNEFNVLPNYTIFTEQGIRTTQNKWKYDHSIKVEVKNGNSLSDADDTMYDVVNYRTCDIQFKNKAIGKVFKITVTPGGLSDEYKNANNCVAVYDDIEVVDGFNVYEANELAYLDTNSPENGFDNFGESWIKFKEENDLDVEFHPNTFVFQNNIKITKDNLCEDLFYNEKDGVPEDIYGTLKDYAEPYRHTLPSNLSINGNYFKLDFSEIPSIKYADGKYIDESFVSHSSLIVPENGNLSVSNLNVSGNGYKSRTTTNDKGQIVTDTSGRGGFIFIKARNLCSTVSIDNVISRGCFISFLGEKSNTEKGYVDVSINRYKAFDNYNSFLYNWGGKITATDCHFESCGGPIVIQDHTGVESGSSYGSADGKTVNGKPSTTTFVDCDLVNYVAGTEAWFVQFGAASIAGDIKSMSDLYASHGASFISVKDGNAYKAACAAQSTADTISAATGGYLTLPVMSGSNPGFFNFIAINKSSEMEGMTNYPVFGEVSIIDTRVKNNNTFCYSRPNMNRAEEIGDLIDLAVKYGLYTDENKSLFEQLKAAQTQATAQIAVDSFYHQIIRSANNFGAPAFQCGNNFGIYNPNVNASDLVITDDGINYKAVDQLFATYTDLTTGAPVVQSSTAIYFNGMMLVMGLQSNGLLELMAQMPH